MTKPEDALILKKNIAIKVGAKYRLTFFVKPYHPVLFCNDLLHCFKTLLKKY